MSRQMFIDRRRNAIFKSRLQAARLTTIKLGGLTQMKTKLLRATFTMCMLLAGGAASNTAIAMQAAPANHQTAKKESKLKKAANDAGKGTKETGKKVGKGREKAGKAVADGSEAVAKGTAKGATKAAKATATGVKKVGHESKKIGRKDNHR